MEEAQQKARAIAECVAGPLQAAVREVETTSQQLPEAEDFHFFSNFERFRSPLAGIRARSEALLRELGLSRQLRLEVSEWPDDVEESYDWLVGVQDDILESVGSALDELGVGAGKGPREFVSSKLRKDGKNASNKEAQQMGVKMASKRKQRPPVPFHVKSLARPQDRFEHPVDNSNTPFKHLTREAFQGSAAKTEPNASTTELKGTSVLEVHAKRLGLINRKSGHPLQEELKGMAFLENFSAEVEPHKPNSMSETPFTFVELPSALEEMAAKLRATHEFAVDLENHHYRSFQGFVCLMQISTRSEDFVVDALTLRDNIGPVLRDVFANPSIRKVIHGSDRDILWLQRDFGIYVCNLFDTGQAARVLNMQSFGLAFLLETFCGVHPDKRYQLADWRLRPLTAAMLRYAREDTHYLLYIYDMLKQMLQNGQSTGELYVEVCKRSRDLCLQLYEKEQFTETSFLQLNGLAEKNFQPHQLAIIAGLYAWRDKLSRKEDESTGYVMPNHLLLRLAEEAPEEPRKLHAILKGAHPIAAVHAASILNVIREAKSRSYTDAPKVNISLQTSRPVNQSAIAIPSNRDDKEEGDLPESATGVIMAQTLDSLKSGREEPCGNSSFTCVKETEVQASMQRAVINTEMLKGNALKMSGSDVGQKDEEHKATENKPIEETEKAADFEGSNIQQKEELHEATENKVVEETEKTGGPEGSDVQQKGEEHKSTEDKLVEGTGKVCDFEGLNAEQKDEKYESVQKKEKDVVVQIKRRSVVGTMFRHSGGLGAMLSGKPQVSSKDEEVAMAMVKAESIRASVVLPFRSASAGLPESVDQQKTDEARIPSPNCSPLPSNTQAEFEEYMALDANNANNQVDESVDKHRAWFPKVDTGDRKLEPGSMPPSLNERYGMQHRKRSHHLSNAQNEKKVRDGRDEKRSKEDKRGDKHASTGFSDIQPYDYAAASRALGFGNGEKDRSDSRGERGRFDASRSMKTQTRPEGIQPGKRRHVFPRSGNRTGTFK